MSPLFNRSRYLKGDVHELTHSDLMWEVLAKYGRSREKRARLSESAREGSLQEEVTRELGLQRSMFFCWGEVS